MKPLQPLPLFRCSGVEDGPRALTRSCAQSSRVRKDPENLVKRYVEAAVGADGTVEHIVTHAVNATESTTRTSM